MKNTFVRQTRPPMDAHLLAWTCLSLGFVHSIPVLAQSGIPVGISIINERLVAVPALAFVAHMEEKPFSQPDTIRSTQQVWALRDPNDLAFGAKLLIKDPDGGFTLYDGTAVYRCTQRNDTCLRYAPRIVNGTLPMGMNHLRKWDDLLRPTALVEGLGSFNGTITQHSEIVTGDDTCTVYRLNYPDQEGMQGLHSEYWRRTEDGMPCGNSFRGLIMGGTQYTHVSYGPISFPAIAEDFFTLAGQGLLRKVIQFALQEVLPPDVGDPAPKISVRHYPGDSLPTTIQWEGSVSFLDFWSLNCGPCRLAMPKIDSLQRLPRFADVRFLALNAWEDMDKDGAELEAFRQQYGLSHTFQQVDKSVIEAFGIRPIPAFLIIDRFGRIAYRSVGFGAGNPEEWADILDRLLLE